MPGLILRRFGAIALVAIGVVAVAASGSSSKSGSPGNGSSSHPAKNDVTITKCALSTNQFEGPTATVKVVNHSTGTSNYLITVAFDSPDGKTQLDTGDATVNNLAPSQTTSTDAPSLKSGLRGKKFVCKVADVTRLAAG